MDRQRRNVIVLSGCQATLQTTGATMIAVTGLAGFALAADKTLATAPLTCYVKISLFTSTTSTCIVHECRLLIEVGSCMRQQNLARSSACYR